MKSLVIAFLLIQSVYGFTRAECVDAVNNGRASYAEKHQWANVNKLLYNIGMEKTLYEHIGVFNGCPRSTVISGKEYQIYTNMNDGEDGELEEYMETDIRNNSYGIPQSTVVACALTTCLDNGKPILSVITDYVKFTVIDGAPGTSCSSGRQANSKGLCYLGSDQKKFVRKGVLQQVGDAMDHTFGWG